MLKKVRNNDLSELQKICKDSYTQIFADHWTKNGLDLYLEQEFGTKRISSDLIDDNIEYHFIQKERKNIGFLKINYKSSSVFPETNNCELEKIYILPSYSGMGIGKMAMKEIIKQINDKGKSNLFLCVIDTNKNATEFYKKLGFKFHSTTRLEVPFFKDELRGMNRMLLKISDA